MQNRREMPISSLHKVTAKAPNFFIVGAAKAGTTSIYAYLAQHPDIYLSRLKEPKYFSSSANTFPHKGLGDIDVDKTVIRSWDDYVKLFDGVRHEIAVGEASADYLYFYDRVIPSIKQISHKAKIIIILRNPVDRAFSAYRHLVKDKRESLSFENALEIEGERKNENYEFIWFYKDVGFYFQQVEAYIETFGSDRTQIYLYDDFDKNPAAVIKDIFGFLEVSDDFAADTTYKHNVSKLAENKPFQDFLVNYNHPLKRLFRPMLLNTIGKDNTEELVNYFKSRNERRIKPKTRKYLTQVYRDDILKLQHLLKRDLSMWLSV